MFNSHSSILSLCVCVCVRTCVHACVCVHVYRSLHILCCCSTAGSSLGDVVSLEDYWRELAEQRRAALADTLMENEEVQS